MISRFCVMLHRLLSTMAGIKALPKLGNIMDADAKEYLCAFSTRRRAYKFQNIKVKPLYLT